MSHPTHKALRLALVGAAAGGLLIALQARAAEDLARQTYEQSCASCHAAGTANAPKFGDKKRWARLQREGQLHVTAHGWLGEGAMPPKGGRADLSLQAFADTVAYMANASGQKWPYSDAELLKRLEQKIDAEQQKKRKP